MAGSSSGTELKGGIPREVPIAMGAPVVTEQIQPVIGQPVDNTPMGLPVAPPPRQPQQPPRLTIGGDEPPSAAGWGSRQEELPRDAQFEREQWQRRGVAAMLVFGLAVQLVDVLSDISLYVAIGNAKEAEREGATAARDNLTALGAASPFYPMSPEVLALNASYGALAPDVQAETCDPLAAAYRLADPDKWEDPVSRLASLEQASLVFIFASILPLLCTMGLTCGHLRRTVTAHSRAAADRRTGQQAPGRGRKAAEVERRGAIVMGQMLVQLAEDVPQVTRRGPLCLALTHGRRSRPHLTHPHSVLSPRDAAARPQSVISGLFVATMLASDGVVCNTCFRRAAEARVAPMGNFTADGGGGGGGGCAVVTLDRYSLESALDSADEGSATALVFSLTMCGVSVLKSAALSGYLLLFRNGLTPRLCTFFSKEMRCCNWLIGLPLALAAWASWVVAYSAFAVAPLVGAVYFHIGGALEFPDWDGTKSSFLTVFLLGASVWCCCLTACAGLCAATCTNPEIAEAMVA